MKKKFQCCLTEMKVMAEMENEFKNWIDNDRFDEGKNAIFVRLVVSEKVKDDIVMIKARLVARYL